MTGARQACAGTERCCLLGCACRPEGAGSLSNRQLMRLLIEGRPVALESVEATARLASALLIAAAPQAELPRTLSLLG